MIDKQVLAVTNFPPKQIGKIMSEVLVLGAVQNDGTVILISPDLNSEIGAQIQLKYYNLIMMYLLFYNIII